MLSLGLDQGANFNGACTMGKEEIVEDEDSDVELIAA